MIGMYFFKLIYIWICVIFSYSNLYANNSCDQLNYTKVIFTEIERVDITDITKIKEMLFNSIKKEYLLQYNEQTEKRIQNILFNNSLVYKNCEQNIFYAYINKINLLNNIESFFYYLENKSKYFILNLVDNIDLIYNFIIENEKIKNDFSKICQKISGCINIDFTNWLKLVNISNTKISQNNNENINTKSYKKENIESNIPSQIKTNNNEQIKTNNNAQKKTIIKDYTDNIARFCSNFFDINEKDDDIIKADTAIISCNKNVQFANDEVIVTIVCTVNYKTGSKIIKTTTLNANARSSGEKIATQKACQNLQ